MRIAYFTETVPPITDGVTLTLSHLVETLTEQGVEFRCISAVRPDPGLEWRSRVHKVPAVPFPPYAYYKVALPLPRTLDRRLDEFAPDLVHVVNPTFLGNYGINYARRRGLPVVGSFHTHFVSYLAFYGLGGFEEIGWRILRWFYNRCAVTYAPSPTTRDELRSRGFERVALWGRGVDPRRFSPAHRSGILRRALGAESAPLVLFVGRMVREKNLDDLVEAVHLLERRGTRFKLMMVGDGPMRRELEARLPGAYFAGKVEGDALARLYASADVFLFPSSTETFGNVVLEAFASGLPVVAVASGGVRDLVQPGVNGLLAPARSPGTLADCLYQLLRDPSEARRLSAGALAMAREYRWSEVQRRLVDSYAHVVAAHRPATEPAVAVGRELSPVAEFPRLHD